MKLTLVVIPTRDTFRRLHLMMTSAPLTLDFDAMYLPVITAQAATAPWTTRPQAIYEDAKAVGVRIHLSEDPEMASHNAFEFNVILQSPSLSARVRELGGVADSFCWTLKKEIPPGRNAQSFLSSLTDILLAKEEAFSFYGEMTIGA